MIKMLFCAGSAVRRVYIKDKVVSLLTPENNFVPMQIDLNNLEANKSKLKGSFNMDDPIWGELSKLTSDEVIAEDIVHDFKKGGWRLLSTKYGD